MIYLDNAATGMPKSTSVGKAMADALKNCGNPGRGGHAYSVRAAETVYDCRKKLAEMFGTRPELVVFTSGATAALNMAIKGTNRDGGVTVVSSLEHNSVIRPVNALRKSGKTVMRQFRVEINDDHETLYNFSVAARSATNAVITHASNVCGRILPIKALRREAPSDCVFILDASQTAGHIPFTVTGLGVDVMCIPGHKGLYGPTGIGALIINPDSPVCIETLLEGGTGTDSKSRDMPETFPERLEPGTQNVCGIAGLSAAIDGFSYPEREKEIFRYLTEEMRRLPGIELCGAPGGDNFDGYVPVLLFNKKGFDCEELCAELSDRGFALRAGYHCAPSAHFTLGTAETGGVRISPGRSNTVSEIRKFLKALDSIKE
ncbi:MAG: aminotransferase class V-fold PLP-dependent enzyme [Clostridia bacterium]|nr:aminotransferase class V-fold PLP-dependent enzyme [Clostridia bacterium]